MSGVGGERFPSEFAPSLLRLQQAPPSPLRRRVLQALLGLLLGLLIWSLVGELDVVAVAEGRLVPQSFIKIVQPTEAGVVRELLVSEGESVRAGQVLMRMDSVISEADGRTLQQEQQRKALTLRRIDAELSQKAFRAAAEDEPALFAEVEAQYQANRVALAAALASERATLERAQGELSAAQQVREKLASVLPHYRDQAAAFETLVKGGFAGAIMASDKRRELVEKEQELRTQGHVIESARAAIAQSETRMAQIQSDHRKQLYVERNEVEAQLERLGQELKKQAHRHALLELRASQDAVVNDVATHTPGTVVQPGTVLMTLVPAADPLKAEVWVRNQDIGFVREGQRVRLKFSTYPFQEYGMAEGRVERVSADANDGSTQDPAAAALAAGRVNREGSGTPLAYRAVVSLNKPYLTQNAAKLPLSAGMQATADILLGSRTVMAYLLSPVREAFHEAARER